MLIFLTSMKIATVMPTMRDAKSLDKFVEIAPKNVDFIVISQEKLSKKFEQTIEFSDQEVFKKSWIFNRMTKREYGYLYAYQNDYDIIITIDDDVYPTNDTYFQDFERILTSFDNNIFNILDLYDNVPPEVHQHGARGHPTEIRSKNYPVVVNQGLWYGDLDLPAKTIQDLKSTDGKIPPPTSNTKIYGDRIIPPFKLTTVCGMNLGFKKETVPAMKLAFQDPDGVGIARYDDIWQGLFIKKILDKLEKRMSAGSPVVTHDKEPRDLQKDINYETKGDMLNNYLYEYLPNLDLEGNDYETCFSEIAHWLDKIGDTPDLKFFKKVSSAMLEWLKILDVKL